MRPVPRKPRKTEAPSVRLRKVCDFVLKHGRRPTRNSVDPEEKTLGIWLHRFMCNYEGVKYRTQLSLPPETFELMLATIYNAPDAKQAADRVNALSSIEVIAQQALKLDDMPMRGVSDSSGSGKKLQAIRQGRIGPSMKNEAIAIVRRVLGDDPKNAHIIEQFEEVIEQSVQRHCNSQTERAIDRACHRSSLQATAQAITMPIAPAFAHAPISVVGPPAVLPSGGGEMYMVVPQTTDADITAPFPPQGCLAGCSGTIGSTSVHPAMHVVPIAVQHLEAQCPIAQYPSAGCVHWGPPQMKMQMQPAPTGCVHAAILPGSVHTMPAQIQMQRPILGGGGQVQIQSHMPGTLMATAPSAQGAPFMAGQIMQPSMLPQRPILGEGGQVQIQSHMPGTLMATAPSAQDAPFMAGQIMQPSMLPQVDQQTQVQGLVPGQMQIPAAW
jgi:hypothetical protein